MKFVEFKCPACGAALKTDLSRDVMFCEYCGKKIILDDEAVHIKVSFDNAREAGYEFENGRMDAHSDNVWAEADKVMRMVNALPECDKLKSRYDALALQYRIDKEKQINIKLLLMWSVICLFLIYLIYDNFRDLTRSFDFSRLMVIFVYAGIIALIVWFQRHKYIKSKIKQETTKKQMDATISDLKTLLTESGLESIPKDLRATECLYYIHNELISQRAFTIPQALHNYNLFQRQLELDEQNRQQLEIQRQQLMEMQEMRKKLEEKEDDDDDDDDSNILGTIAAIGLGVIVGRSLFKK